MATSFDTIEDLALTVISDYKLVKLYNQSEEDFKTYCDGFLVNAVPNFTQCQQDLSYDLTTRTFTSDFTALEISILADFWAISWLTKEVQDATQINLKLSTSGGFETHSEAQNLKEKSSWLDRLRERVYQKITDYQLLDESIYSF